MSNDIKRFRYVIFVIGFLLSLATGLAAETSNRDLIPYSIQFAIWASVPYIVFLVASSLTKNNSAIISAGVLILGFDIFTHVSVIFFPGSSTDVLALLFMPLWLTVLFLPTGFFLGWLIGKATPKFKHKQKEEKGEIFLSGKSDDSL